MKLIIGLGNPTPEYHETRHNVGFLFLDHLRSIWNCDEFRNEKKFLATITDTVRENEKVLLIKPETYMNDSGSSIRAILDFYKLLPSDILVIHDDMDISFGSWKTTASSRAAGHNGVADIIEKLGTQDFSRIRIGIGRPKDVLNACIPAHDFVLQKFSSDELALLESLFPDISLLAEQFVVGHHL